MDVMNYILENALILIPVLIIIGQIVKGIELIPDKFIPLILLGLGVVGGIAVGFSFGLALADSIIQGVLVAGAAVYGNQIYKQLKKDE